MLRELYLYQFLLRRQLLQKEYMVYLELQHKDL